MFAIKNEKKIYLWKKEIKLLEKWIKSNIDEVVGWTLSLTETCSLVFQYILNNR